MMQLFIVTIMCFEETVVYTSSIYQFYTYLADLSLPLAHLHLLDYLKLFPGCFRHTNKLLNTDTVRWISWNTLLLLDKMLYSLTSKTINIQQLLSHAVDVWGNVIALSFYNGNTQILHCWHYIVGQCDHL